MRIKSGIVRKKRVKALLKKAKGFRGSSHTRFAIAKEKVLQAERYQYVSRRLFKRDVRSLWIQRINIAVRMIEPEMNYSQFIHGLKTINITLNRKVLAQMAVEDKSAFETLVKQVKAIA